MKQQVYEKLQTKNEESRRRRMKNNLKVQEELK